MRRQRKDLCWCTCAGNARGLLVDLTPLPATRQHHLLQGAGRSLYKKEEEEKNSRSIGPVPSPSSFVLTIVLLRGMSSGARPDGRPAASSRSDGLGPGFIPLNSSIHHRVREEDGDLCCDLNNSCLLLAAMKSSCLQ